jgi:hypothetical protein
MMAWRNPANPVFRADPGTGWPGRSRPEMIRDVQDFVTVPTNQAA